MVMQNIDVKIDWPLSKALWPGALLATVFHAVFICRASFLSHQHSWDGLNYSVQDTAGSRGTIAFGENKEEFVGVFYLERSSRNPLDSSDLNIDYIFPVRGMPDKMRKLSDEALSYVYRNINGVSTPVITSAFWSQAPGNRIEANETWSNVVEHGAILVKNELSPLDVAMKKWAEDYALESDEVGFVRSLFDLRLRSKDRRLILDASKLVFLRNKSSDEEGFRASLETFSEIGIYFEGNNI